jgi:hypothetical protein
MKYKVWTLRVLIALVLIISLAVIAAAQDGGQPENGEPDSAMSVTTDVASGFSYQGVLTEGGAPVNGNRDMQFRLYSGSTQVGSAISKKVAIHQGQFNVFLSWSRDRIDGKALSLEVRAKDKHGVWRNLGKTTLHPVPYAMSLKPGAWVRTSSNVIPYALSLQHLGHGAGLRAGSETGPAIDAVGTGVIRSTAKSYLWISGNGLRPEYSSDSTIFAMDQAGGVDVRRGNTSGSKKVILPVTIPGQLYGQNITITGIDVTFKSQTNLDGIEKTTMRRQSHPGSGQLMVNDISYRVCEDGCTYHLDITDNNVLSDGQGIVYISFQLFFLSNASYVDIGGVRLTLEHR